MMSRMRWLMMMALVLTMGVALGGCADRGVRAYVAGWDGLEAEDRQKLTEHQAQSRLTLLEDLETAEDVDYVVLVPLPGERSAAASEAPRGEVMSRTQWFAMLSEHSNAEQIARAREIPLIELGPFLRMLEPAAPPQEVEAPAEEEADADADADAVDAAAEDAEQ